MSNSSYIMLEYLALWPVIHFILIYIVSKINNKIDLLHNIYAIIYLDWLFVPFNYLIVSSVNFSWMLFLIFLCISLITTIFLHKKWHKNNNGSRQANYFIDKNGLTTEGWIHFIFMVVQASLVLTVLLSVPTSINFSYMIICLLAYIIGYMLIVKFVRKINLNSKAEMPFLIIGLIIVILRIVLYIIL